MSADTRPEGVPQPSDLATTLTETSAHMEDVLSRDDASVHRTSPPGKQGHTSVEPAQAQGDSAVLSQSNTASTQQQSAEGVQQQQQQQAVANTEGGSPGCGPQPGGQSSGRAWKPSPPAELPVRSITQVACLGLVSEFLYDIGQVTTIAGFSSGGMVEGVFCSKDQLHLNGF